MYILHEARQTGLGIVALVLQLVQVNVSYHMPGGKKCQLIYIISQTKFCITREMKDHLN